MIIALIGGADSTDGREVFPVASRPVEVPSPGRTGSGGGAGCTNTSLPGGLIEIRCDEPAALPCYRQVSWGLWLWGCDGVPRPAPEPRIGGVYCAGAPGLDWEWVGGGVLSYVTCDGVRVRALAFTPSVASDGSGPPRRVEPWDASWPAAQWENVRAVDACESSSGMHPDTYRTDLIHGGRMQIARGVWAEFFEREYGWSWEQIVTDDETNFAAAYVIYERAGGWGPWPVCGRGR